MRKKNPFEMTVYYSGNTCIINPEHSVPCGGVLTWLLNFRGYDCGNTKATLKKLLEKLLFKLDGDYIKWEEYDRNVYLAQGYLNEIKDLLLTLPIYEHLLKPEDLDYEDLIHTLSLHGELFDHSFDLKLSHLDYEKHSPNMDECEETLDDEEVEPFDDSRVRDDLSNFEDDLRHFRPYWHDGDYSADEINGAELLNTDLRNLIEPYMEFLDTVEHIQERYGTFLDRYIHTKGRFLTDGEIATSFARYQQEVSNSQALKPTGSIQLECKTIWQNDAPVWCDVYTFDSPSGFLYFDFFRGLGSGYIPKKCEHCGRYFLLTSGRYYEFCDTPIENMNGKTCRDIGSHRKYEEKCKSDPIWLAYNRAYKAHYARLLKKKMTKSEFLTWSNWAVEYRDAALRGGVAIEEYEMKIRE